MKTTESPRTSASTIGLRTSASRATGRALIWFQTISAATCGSAAMSPGSLILQTSACLQSSGRATWAGFGMISPATPPSRCGRSPNSRSEVDPVAQLHREHRQHVVDGVDADRHRRAGAIPDGPQRQAEQEDHPDPEPRVLDVQGGEQERGQEETELRLERASQGQL